MSHEHSPAELLRRSLVLGGLGVLRSTNPTGAWPIYVGHMPDAPDEAMCLYDTSGFAQGRVLHAGDPTLIEKPGIQLRVRAGGFRTGYAKVRALSRHLTDVYKQTVVLGADWYMIHAMHQTGTALAIGREPGGDRRELFTLNAVMTYTAAQR